MRFASVIILTAVLTPLMHSQQASSPHAGEAVSLVTDRGLYIAGERIRLSALVLPTVKTETVASRVVYAEVISADGQSMVGGKFEVDGAIAHGCLSIPATIISGVYYLRAYTRLMRNAGPRSYAYVAVKIVNPSREDVHTGTIHLPDQNSNQGTAGNGMRITIDRQQYGLRETVSAILECDQCPAGGWPDLSVSVVPEGALPLSVRSVDAETSGSNTTTYFPETRSVSLSGVLRDGPDGKVMPGVQVSLSIIGKDGDVMSTTTDGAGRFLFAPPPYIGTRDIFICAENANTMSPQLLIDNDFSTASEDLPAYVLELSKNERETALQMARNTLVSQEFDDRARCSNASDTSTTAFFGKPTEVLKMDEFVALPTMEEYFNELPSGVKVRKQHGHPYFKVLGTRPEMAYLDPLVLVDGVAINDPEAILAASPANIARIEVVKEPYAKGDAIYGGVVNIVSRKGDFAGIDLPTSGIFLNYQFLSDTCQCVQPVPVRLQVPDARNTLYWEPHVALRHNENARLTFRTSDVEGRYVIVVQGTDSDGLRLIRSKAFEVVAGQ